MIKIRDLAKEIIYVQLDTYTYDIETFDELFNKKLEEFNRIYDEFVAKYGYINSRTNILLSMHNNGTNRCHNYCKHVH